MFAMPCPTKTIATAPHDPRIHSRSIRITRTHLSLSLSRPRSSARPRRLRGQCVHSHRYKLVIGPCSSAFRTYNSIYCTGIVSENEHLTHASPHIRFDCKSDMYTTPVQYSYNSIVPPSLTLGRRRATTSATTVGRLPLPLLLLAVPVCTGVAYVCALLSMIWNFICIFSLVASTASASSDSSTPSD